MHLERARSLPVCLIGPRKLFEVLIRESLCDNVQKAGDLPIVTDVGEVIAGSGYAGWLCEKAFANSLYGVTQLPTRRVLNFSGEP